MSLIRALVVSFVSFVAVAVAVHWRACHSRPAMGPHARAALRCAAPTSKPLYPCFGGLLAVGTTTIFLSTLSG